LRGYYYVGFGGIRKNTLQSHLSGTAETVQIAKLTTVRTFDMIKNSVFLLHIAPDLEHPCIRLTYSSPRSPVREEKTGTSYPSVDFSVFSNWIHAVLILHIENHDVLNNATD
jgi:hypothetical protein